MAATGSFTQLADDLPKLALTVPESYQHFVRVQAAIVSVLEHLALVGTGREASQVRFRPRCASRCAGKEAT